MDEKVDFRKQAVEFALTIFLCKQIINYCGIINDVVSSGGLT